MEKIEREQKKQNAALEMERRKENSLKKQEKEQLKTDRKTRSQSCAADCGDLHEERKIKELMQNLIFYSDENSHSDEEEERATCPPCGLIYPDNGGFWIDCDDWFDLKCTDIKK